jgi:hypothetical protein
VQFDRLARYQLDEYDISPLDVIITFDMNVDQFGEFIEDQGFQIHRR